ncbi:MAG: glycoside hydrolase family 57 [Subdoligranulum variabile]|nr:MAG: glycoside hydrolase family 57 [Subdoligranulum variabile]
MNNTPKVVFMPHANLQYSQLRPEKREWVIHNCYEKLFDLIRQRGWHMAFEASGKTLDWIYEQAPEVMGKLRKLVQEGQIEPVASPYIHFMMANVPRELCLRSLKRGIQAWVRCTGKAPRIGWNPECGWTSYILDVYKEAGLEAIILDADSFFLSFDEIRQATGLHYDVQGHSNKTKLARIESYIEDKPEFLKYLTKASQAPNGLKVIMRTDCIANLLLWYLMGATEGARSQPVSGEEIETAFSLWKNRIAATGNFVMAYAEDAEYIGSSAYFYVKQFNEARFFEPEPDSIRRFEEIVEKAEQVGLRLALPSDVLQETVDEDINRFVECVENGVAWHGGTAKAWANTEQSLVLDPVCRSILEGIQTVEKHIGNNQEAQASLERAFDALESAWVSDARWPPEPTSPGRFNVREAIQDLYTANAAIEEAMQQAGIAAQRSLYSPSLMHTQIRATEKKLMEMKYFEEGC